MTRTAFLIFCSISICTHAQVRVTKLLIKSKQIFHIHPADIIVADTLMMMDSSVIRLNDLKTENFIRARVAIFGNHCVINGKGFDGALGKKGATGTTLYGPCREGTPGRNGSRGLDGTPGINLFLYIDKIIVRGSLIIDLSGGNGGDGGTGGEGGGGSPGTLHCNGGDGGPGGRGGRGGNGGLAGTLTLGGLNAAAIKTMIGTQVLVNIKGGNFGYGGISGAGGSPGLGPKRNGRHGQPGVDGFNGMSGNNGSIQFEQQ